MNREELKERTKQFALRVMRLVDALPKSKVAAHAETSADLVDAVCAAVRPGDAVTVKGSLSMKMALVVKALKERYGASSTAHALKG